MAEDTVLGMCTLEYGDAADTASVTTWTPVGQIEDIAPPSLEADDIETSNMSNTDRVKRFRAGWLDSGEVEVSSQYAKAVYAALLALVRVKRAWRITFDDTSPITIDDSYIKSLQPPVDREGIAMTDFTIKVSGPITFTPAA